MDQLINSLRICNRWWDFVIRSAALLKARENDGLLKVLRVPFFVGRSKRVAPV